MTDQYINLDDALEREKRDREQPTKPTEGAFDSSVGDRNTPFSQFTWPEPKSLPNGLLPVASFDPDALPASLAPWICDISDRMQCPLDFVAIPALVALGSVVGCKIGIRPQRKTDWIEVPNLWGCIVGRPGAMKSPALKEAIRPLERLEALARKKNANAAAQYAVEMDIHKIKVSCVVKQAKAAHKLGEEIEAIDRVRPPEEPKSRRYLLHDTTYEALGEVLVDNPIGILAFRDELMSMLRMLDREEAAAARGFFLTAWGGTSSYSFDRITRGKLHIESACLSLLGSTQPGRLAEYVRRAVGGGGSDDGLIQRFGLLVWPDQTPEWRDVDRFPDNAARDKVWDTFTRLDALNPDAIAAQRDDYESIPFLRFDEAAQSLFSDWRREIEFKLRAGDLHPALESHLAKYRKLVPAVALLLHLADSEGGPIGEFTTPTVSRFVTVPRDSCSARLCCWIRERDGDGKGDPQKDTKGRSLERIHGARSPS